MREILDLKRFFVVCAVAVCASMGARGALAADASCGVNLFNPMILTEADFRAGNDNSYSGQWNKNLLNAYLSTSDFGFDTTKKYSLRYKMKCDGDNGKFFFVLKNSDGQVFGPGNGTSLNEINVCATNPGAVVEIKITDVEKVVAVEAYGDGTGLVQISDIMLGLSTNIDRATNFIAYSPCIKLATTKMNETRMSAIENRLGGVRTTINNLITQMQTNSGNVGQLQVNKQTRPNSSCPADKKCLLVKDMQNNDNWYEIVDCNENAFFSNMGASIGGGSNPVGSTDAGKYCDNNYNSVGNSRPDCADGEWGHLYANGMVYGEAKAASIAESVGTVVTLPNNVTAGDTCVCRVTGYAPLVSGAYANSVTSFTTDRWVVGGRISEHYASMETLPEATDAACVNVCGFDDENGLVSAAYYVSISNSCSGSVDQAHICSYHRFLGTLGREGTYSQTGSHAVNSNGWAECQNPESGSVWANHCVSGGWVTKYTISNVAGWAWGRGGYVTVPDGVEVGDVINNLSSYDFSLTASGAHNAIVCTVDGYKNGGMADQSVNFDAAVVYRLGSSGDGSGHFVPGANGAATGCAEWSEHATEMKSFYRQLAGMCSAD